MFWKNSYLCVCEFINLCNMDDNFAIQFFEGKRDFEPYSKWDRTCTPLGLRVLRALFFFFIVCALQANAQTEQNGKGIIAGNDASLPTMEFDNHLMPTPQPRK